jgi:phosphatidate cytidylyltransferase
MPNLLYRILTALFLLPLVVLAIALGGYYLVALLSVASLVAIWELARALNITSRPFFISLAYVLVFLPWIFLNPSLPPHLTLFWPLACFYIFALLVPKFTPTDLEKCSTFLCFSLYILVGIASLFWLQADTLVLDRASGLSLIVLCLLSAFANDSFAYFGGRLLGKHPLMPSVSGKKTWEGFFCGAVGSIVVAAAAGFYLASGAMSAYINFVWSDFWWVVLPVAVLCPMGDLIESRLKRFYDLKDSSNILPGHGGVLDRIDGLLLVLPWTLFYAFIIR